MDKYESVIIVEPNLSKKSLSNVTLKVENKIKEFDENFKKVDNGIKRLAYKINKNNEGHYISYYFEINADKKDAIKEIEGLYKITDEIMRYITVKC